jgi:hypothetical protein
MKDEFNSNGGIKITQYFDENKCLCREIEQDGKLRYSQKTAREFIGKTETFLDIFFDELEHLPTEYCSKHGYNVRRNIRDLLYLFPERRSQTLNLKLKLFNFLLKYVFLKGKPASIENVKGFYERCNSDGV